MDFLEKKVLVVGLGKTGLYVLRWLSKEKAHVAISDSKSEEALDQGGPEFGVAGEGGEDGGDGDQGDDGAEGVPHRLRRSPLRVIYRPGTRRKAGACRCNRYVSGASPQAHRV